MKKKKQFFWLMIFYFETILRKDLDFETKAIIGKDCPKSLMAIYIENWRNLKQKIYVEEKTVKNFKVKIKIEKEIVDGYCRVSFPGEIPKNRLTKIVVSKRLISKNP
jgi:hypothetical protein